MLYQRILKKLYHYKRAVIQPYESDSDHRQYVCRVVKGKVKQVNTKEVGDDIVLDRKILLTLDEAVMKGAQ